METATKRLARWRDDPVAFVREALCVEPDAWQIDYLMAYATGRRVAAKACKGPGKTAVMSWCACTFFLPAHTRR